MDRAEGFYWVSVKDSGNGGDYWDISYWTGSAWQNSPDQRGSIEQVGAQLQPPETGSRVRPMGRYWIQLLANQAAGNWQVAYWTGWSWSLILPKGSSYPPYSADDSEVYFIGPLLPDGP